MKKIHRAVQKGPNKWEKKTGWKWDTEDYISLAILLVVAGFVTIRALIG
jgi:cytochrome P450